MTRVAMAPERQPSNRGRSGPRAAALRLVVLVTVLGALLAPVAGTAAASPSAPGEFIREAFGGAMPRPQAVFLTDALRARVERVLGHRTTLLRVRYWRQGERTVWVLDEIGKEQPITTGVQVDGRAITRLQVLQYRESRGGEVQRASFTSQFLSARLVAGDDLDRRIDGITGATMSVRALTRQARMALVLHDALANGHGVSNGHGVAIGHGDGKPSTGTSRAPR